MAAIDVILPGCGAGLRGNGPVWKCSHASRSRPLIVVLKCAPTRREIQEERRRGDALFVKNKLSLEVQPRRAAAACVVVGVGAIVAPLLLLATRTMRTAYQPWFRCAGMASCLVHARRVNPRSLGGDDDDDEEEEEAEEAAAKEPPPTAAAVHAPLSTAATADGPDEQSHQQP